MTTATAWPKSGTSTRFDEDSEQARRSTPVSPQEPLGPRSLPDTTLRFGPSTSPLGSTSLLLDPKWQATRALDRSATVYPGLCDRWNLASSVSRDLPVVFMPDPQTLCKIKTCTQCTFLSTARPFSAAELSTIHPQRRQSLRFFARDTRSSPSRGIIQPACMAFEYQRSMRIVFAFDDPTTPAPRGRGAGRGNMHEIRDPRGPRGRLICPRRSPLGQRHASPCAPRSTVASA